MHNYVKILLLGLTLSCTAKSASSFRNLDECTAEERESILKSQVYVSAKHFPPLYQAVYDLQQLFEAKGIKAIALFGGSLGILRNEELIPWDDNFDFGVTIDQEDKIKSLAPLAYKLGYSLSVDDLNGYKFSRREPLVDENSGKDYNLEVNICLYRLDGEKYTMSSSEGKATFPNSWLKKEELETIEMRRCGPIAQLPCSKYAKDHVMRMYGEHCVKVGHFYHSNIRGGLVPTRYIWSIGNVAKYPAFKNIRLENRVEEVLKLAKTPASTLVSELLSIGEGERQTNAIVSAEIKEIRRTDIRLTKSSGEIVQFFMPAEYKCEHASYANMYSLTLDEANKRMEQLREQAIVNILSEEYKHADLVADGAANITHKMWVTNPENPKPFGKDVLANMIVTYRNLAGYRHFFWTNCPDVLADAFATIKDAGINLEVHHIDELQKVSGWSLFCTYIKNNLFSNAANIVRLQVLHEFGGIYSDAGWPISREITSIIGNFDYVTSEFSGNSANHNFMFMKKHNPVCKKMLSNLEDREFMRPFLESNYIRNVTELACPRMLTTTFAALSGPNTKLLILFSGQHTYQEMQLNTWRIKGKFGSSIPSECDMKKFVSDYMECVGKKDDRKEVVLKKIRYEKQYN